MMNIYKLFVSCIASRSDDQREKYSTNLKKESKNVTVCHETFLYAQNNPFTTGFDLEACHDICHFAVCTCTKFARMCRT